MCRIDSHWWMLACTACWSSCCGHMTWSHSNALCVPSSTYARRKPCSHTHHVATPIIWPHPRCSHTHHVPTPCSHTHHVATPIIWSHPRYTHSHHVATPTMTTPSPCSESVSVSVASLNCATPLLHIISSYDTVSRHLASDLLLLLSQQSKLQEQIHDSDCLPQCLRYVNSVPCTRVIPSPHPPPG